jgi:hypothetical protein
MQKLKQPVLFFCFIVMTSIVYAQSTVGIGEVTAIESKAKRILDNRQRISQYKEQLASLDSAWKARIQRMQNEINALYKEMDDLIRDMKVGAKCSQCGKYKSEFEKQGIDFQKHLGEVKGYAVPAPTSELEATRALYREKIAYKKVQLLALQKEDPAIAAKKKQIDDTEKDNTSLCTEITEHSKRYDKQVFADAKSKHESWVNELLNYVTPVLIATDKITIYNARIDATEVQFQKDAAEKREALKKQNEENQALKNDKIARNKQQLAEAEVQLEQLIDPKKAAKGEYQKELGGIETDLRMPKLKDSLRVLLTARKTEILAAIKRLDGEILSAKTSYENTAKKLLADNKILDSEIWQLKIGLPKEQELAVAKIRAAADARIRELRLSVTNATSERGQAQNAYNDRVDQVQKRQTDLYNLIGTESGRMLTASQPVNCPVYNQARSDVGGNWNQVFPCVQAVISLSKPYSSHVFNAYCPSASNASYLSGYKSFLRGLNVADMEAVQKTTNKGWLEELLK